MVKKIVYSSLIIFLVLIITLGTLLIQIKRRNIELYNGFLSEASNGDFTNFLKIQTNNHLLLEEVFLDDYQVLFYLTKTETETNLLVIVRALNDVNHALTSNDEFDLTKAIISADELVIYNSKDQDNYGDFAISSGLEKLSFYYYQVLVTEESEVLTELFDYDNKEILTKKVSLTTEEEFIKGFNQEEIYELLKMQKSYLNLVYIVFSISFLIGSLLIILLFRKK